MSADRAVSRQNAAGSPQGRPFGEQLRRAREAKGISLEALADATRIALHHLKALERSDLEALPGGPFGKGYVRTCATVLGVDPGPILESYRAQERQKGVGSVEGERQMMEQLSHLVGRRAEEPRRGLPGARAAAIVGAVLLLVTVGALGRSLVRARAVRPAAAVAQHQPAGPPTAVSRAAQPPASGIRPSRRPPERSAAAEPPPSKHTAAPKPSPAATVAAPADGRLSVTEHGVGSGLADHRLVGQSDRFATDGRVAFWTVVRGGRPGDVIQHVWLRNDRVVATTDLPVGSSHWRTWSRVYVPPGGSGHWAAEARTSDGLVLARDEFVCEPAGQ